MSIQSTITLSRAEAEEKYVQQNLEEIEKELRRIAKIIDNKELEDEIEETYYNYTIGVKS